MVALALAEPSKVKLSTGHKVGSCLDKRLLKELVEQGLLSNDDVNKVGHLDVINNEIGIKHTCFFRMMPLKMKFYLKLRKPMKN